MPWRRPPKRSTRRSRDDGVRLLRDILLRLVEASGDGAVISRRVERTLIAIDDAHARIVDRLVDARLLTTDEESVQLSHEALAREWPRLKEWLADDVEGQRIMRHLGSAAAAWDAMERPDSELYRGGRLTAAQHWRDTVGPALTALEREFLEASAAHEAAGLAAARRQLRRLSLGDRRRSRSRDRRCHGGPLRGVPGKPRRGARHGRRSTPHRRAGPRGAGLRSRPAARRGGHPALGQLRDTRQPRTRLLERTPSDEHHPHPGRRSGRRKHVTRGGRDSSIGDRQRPRCASVRSREEVPAPRILAVRQVDGVVRDRPRHWGRRVQRDIQPL